MAEMELFRIRIDENRGEQVIVLKEKTGSRCLPIIIGILEASAIKMKISGFQSPRPMTHDLLKDVIAGLGAKLEKIVVDSLDKNIFYAKLHIRTADGKLSIVDARPSDSVALALRANSPIFVEEEVLKKVGVTEGKGD